LIGDKNGFHFTMVPITGHNLFWVTFYGRFTIKEISCAHDEFTRHEEFVQGIDELLDFSSSSLVKLNQKTMDIIRTFMKEQTDRHDSRSAIVVNTELEYGLSRMLGANLDRDAPVDRGVFYNIEDALAWLRPGETEEIMSRYKEAIDSNKTFGPTV
jgi:hypothetical protein